MQAMAMNPKSWLFCFLVGSVGPVLVLGEWDKTFPQKQSKISPEDQAVPSKQAPADGQGQRVLLWLLSVAAIYGVVHLLEDFAPEVPLPVELEEGEVARCDTCLVRTLPLPKRNCATQASLRFLEQREQDMITMLYKLHRYKSALATSWLPEDQVRRTREGTLPSSVVVYKIYE